MRTLSLLLPVLLLGACAADTDDTAAADPGEVTTDDGLYLIHLAPSSDPFVSGEAVTLQMHLHKAGTEDTISGATIAVTPFMPDMGHGMDTPPTVTEGEMGLYTAAWTFPMSGYWELDVDIDGSEGTDAVTLPYAVE